MKVNEIFLSVSGECGQFLQGSWVVFVRLAGCNLRCFWCDTVRAQGPDTGRGMTPEAVAVEVNRIGSGRTPRVIITGGEPLTQYNEVVDLIDLLHQKYFGVQVETNGSIIPPPLRAVTWVMDYKLPSSGMTALMIPISAFQLLPVGSWIKFVIADEQDYQEAQKVVEKLRGYNLNLAFSACPPTMTHATLYRRMKADGLTDILLNVQIHKLAELKES